MEPGREFGERHSARDIEVPRGQRLVQQEMLPGGEGGRERTHRVLAEAQDFDTPRKTTQRAQQLAQPRDSRDHLRHVPAAGDGLWESQQRFEIASQRNKVRPTDDREKSSRRPSSPRHVNRNHTGHRTEPGQGVRRHRPQDVEQDQVSIPRQLGCREHVEERVGVLSHKEREGRLARNSESNLDHRQRIVA
jgi:hypothetical protein